MAITSISTPTQSLDPRFGLYYYPDTFHYREADLQAWLPEMQDLGASWLVLRSDLDRAIPERFLRGLKQAGIEPVIQFPLSMERLPVPKEIGMLLDVYARWGARYLVFFDRPNSRAAWPASGWVQQELVERFLDRYIPTANQAMQAGLVPVFPPLEPGGNYWDTAFLRSALQAMQRRRQESLLQTQVLSAYAWTGGHSLDWGTGGPERWPQARPYLTADGGQDQCGFRIFEWYQAIARSVLHHDCPIMLFQAGQATSPAALEIEPESELLQPAAACERITRLLAGENVIEPQAASQGVGNELEPIPAYVIACNFWLLCADPDSPQSEQAWFSGPGHRRKTAEVIHAWRREQKIQGSRKTIEKCPIARERVIQHYLLLPGYDWGVSDWYLEVIRPYVKKYRPTVGFSLEEAEKAARVIVVGNAQNYPEDLLNRLQKAGCWVEQISGDGTKIASELAER